MNNTVVANANNVEIKRLMKAAATIGSPDQYKAKRKQPRIRAPIWLEVCFDPASGETPRTATLDKISEGGISFWLRTKVAEGQIVYVREATDDQRPPWLKAQVVHCSPGVLGILIGTSFKP